ncbi:MAG: hypothetical protein AAF850_05005 [Pseudomonadota bacterium]
MLTTVACVSVPTATFADQTDARLDQLFDTLRRGDAIEAEETADRIRSIWSDAASDTIDLIYARAKISAEQGEHERSETLLNHLLGLAPSFAQGHALRGIVRLSLGDDDGAFKDLNEALRLEPRHFEARIAVSDILAASGEKRGAYEALQEALRWNPHSDAALTRSRALRRELEGQEI